MKTAWGSLVASLAAPLIVLLLLLCRIEPPAPKPDTAPADLFSAGRAISLLQSLLREQVPHPVGSATNKVVHDRIVARFRELGYEVDLQERFACSPAPTCATVDNIIARRPEDDRKAPAVLMVAHYDSVPAGPAATDDGVGVASLLEIARAVRGQRFRDPIVFLIDDGEEAGLLGAEAFVADRALLANVVVLVNVENRGTSGPSLLFETSPRNRWLMETAAQALERPISTSLFYTIYTMLPNDTDLTVFKREGLQGVNFAAIGTVAHYHTPLDNLVNANAGTLQHHGQNALAMLRAFGNRDLTQRSNDDATFFDVAGFRLLTWPAALNVWLALTTLAVLVVSAARRKIGLRSIAMGILAFLAAVVLAAVFGYAVSLVARIRTGSIVWVAHPLPSIVAAWLAGIAGASVAASLVRRWNNGLCYGIAIAWALLGLALAIVLPGTSYILIIPAAIAGLFSVTSNDRAMSIAWSAAAALLFFPFGIVLYDALGTPSIVIIAVILGIVATTFTPLVEAPARLAALAGAGALVAAIIAITQPPYTSQRPKRMNFAYMDGRWIATSLTDEVKRVAPFQESEELTGASWTRSVPRFAAPAPRLSLPAPELEIVSDVKGSPRRIVARVKSRRAADRIALFIRGENSVNFVRVNGFVPPAPSRGPINRPPKSWRRAAVVGTEATIEISVDGDKPIEAIAADYSYGLPPQAKALVEARKRSLAHPSDEGDLTIANQKTRF